MNIIWILLPFALALGFGFLFAFIWSAVNGEFDDLETPAHRMLLNELTEEERSSCPTRP